MSRRARAARHALLLLAVAAAVGVLSRQRADGAPATPREAAPINVRRIYQRDCGVCHGSDGRGTNRGPTIVGVGAAFVDYELSTGRMPLVADVGRQPRSRVQQPLPGEQLGNPDAVPKRRSPAYSPAVIRKLVDYVVRFGRGGPGIPAVDVGRADVARGGVLFRLQCAACHAWAGDGGALLHREAPQLHQSTPVQIAEAVRAGPGAMPAFGRAAFTARELDNVVGYVRYLAHPRDRGGQPLWHLGPAAEGAVAWVIGIGLLLAMVGWIGDREPGG